MIAQFDPQGRDVPARRYEILRGDTIKEDQTTGWIHREIDMADTTTLSEFILWGLSDYPAENYMVVLSGHGSGTDDDYLLRDEEPPGYMSISELEGYLKN